MVLQEGRELLTEPEAKALIAHCGIPVVPTQCVGEDPDAAAGAAVLIGFPVALKILSKDISHKSDIGGVALDLKDAAAVRQAAQEMLTRVRRERPTTLLQGFTVQAMVARKHAQELIIGSTVDANFGPVILFGQGGTAVEVVADRAMALPPLNTSLARNLVSRTRVSRLLQGWRDTPSVDQLALQNVLVAVSQLLEQIPQIAELDINPLIANFEGVIALDARVRVSATAPGGTAHFAILPYPAEWEETVLWRDKSVVLRPIRPDDEAMHEAFLRQLDPRDVRMRVLYSKRTLARSELARLVQIDYAREMAFIAVSTGPDGLPQTLGVARAMGDPDNLAAEFGLIVRSDLKGGGLGELLLKKLIAYFRSRGTNQLVASVLRENYAMRHLAKKLGFIEVAEGLCDGDTKSLSLNLQ
jgi:acetyltransferase